MKKFNLVLDMDETLIHSCKISNENIVNDDIIHLLHVYVSDEKKYNVYYRPKLFEFLEEASKKFNLYIFSFGLKEYISIIVDKICQKLNYNPFCGIYCREDFNGSTWKSLYVSDIRDNNTIIIDDNVNVWPFNNHNLIQINPYYGPNIQNYENDNDLLFILNKLNKMFDDYETNDAITDIETEDSYDIESNITYLDCVDDDNYENNIINIVNVNEFFSDPHNKYEGIKSQINDDYFDEKKKFNYIEIGLDESLCDILEYFE